MSIKRNRSQKKASWLSRFWRWLTQNAGEIEPESDSDTLCPPAPEALPPKAADYQPQGQLYKLLSQRPRLIAGIVGSNSNGLQVYHYCGVVFYKADTVYHYLNPGLELHVGDRVLVPVHIHGGTQTAEGLVVSSGEYLAQCVPYPVSQASMIIKKL